MCKNYASKFIFWVISLKICVSNCSDGTPDKVSVFCKKKEAENMVRRNASLTQNKNKMKNKPSERKNCHERTEIFLKYPHAL